MILDLYAKATATSSLQDIYSWSLECCNNLGVDYFIYSARVPDTDNRFQSYLISNAIDETNVGLDALLLLSNEIAVEFSQAPRPRIWASSRKLGLPRRISTTEMGASETKIADGMTLSVRGPNGSLGAFSFAVSEGMMSERDCRTISCALHIGTNYIFEALVNMYGRTAGEYQNLSRRESECLSWLAQGKTTWEIGRILEISERTAEFHISNIVDKLDCRNRQHALAKAITHGLIHSGTKISVSEIKYLPRRACISAHQ